MTQDTTPTSGAVAKPFEDPAPPFNKWRGEMQAAFKSSGIYAARSPGTGNKLTLRWRETRKAVQPAHQWDQPAQQAPAGAADANYHLIDRFLRNNLCDDDYAEYSAALDALASAPAQPITDTNTTSGAADLPEALRRAGKNEIADELEATAQATAAQQAAPARDLAAVIKGAADKLDAAVRCHPDAVDTLIHEALEILDGDREPDATPASHGQAPAYEAGWKDGYKQGLGPQPPPRQRRQSVCQRHRPHPSAKQKPRSAHLHSGGSKRWSLNA